MGNCTFFKNHDWKTVAIDTTHGWMRKNRKSGEKTFEAQHIIKFVVCKHCGKREIQADDPTADGRSYALNGHEDVGIVRAVWEETGKVTRFNAKDITWVDPSYAPLQGFEKIIDALKKDPEFKELLSNQMVDDALGQLEVAVKLHVKNKIQVDTE